MLQTILFIGRLAGNCARVPVVGSLLLSCAAVNRDGLFSQIKISKQRVLRTISFIGRLAGNRVSVPVIGSALLSTLLVGASRRHFRQALVPTPLSQATTLIPGQDQDSMDTMDVVEPDDESEVEAENES